MSTFKDLKSIQKSPAIKSQSAECTPQFSELARKKTSKLHSNLQLLSLEDIYKKASKYLVER